jgi:hypothetical protein
LKKELIPRSCQLLCVRFSSISYSLESCCLRILSVGLPYSMSKLWLHLEALVCSMLSVLVKISDSQEFAMKDTFYPGHLHPIHLKVSEYEKYSSFNLQYRSYSLNVWRSEKVESLTSEVAYVHS